LFFQEGEDVEGPAARLFFPKACVWVTTPVPAPSSRGEVAVGTDVIQEGESYLPQVIRTLGPPCRLPGCLNGGQQQGDKNSDNRDHHQQLDERESALIGSHSADWAVGRHVCV
jgi:hypothetical protein